MANILRQLNTLVDSSSTWLNMFILAFLVIFSLVSIYARINTDFGAKAFTRIPKEDLRKDTFHIIKYTIIPVIITIYYIYLLFF